MRGSNRFPRTGFEQSVLRSEQPAGNILNFLITLDSRFDSSNEFWSVYNHVDNRVDFLMRSMIVCDLLFMLFFEKMKNFSTGSFLIH